MQNIGVNNARLTIMLGAIPIEIEGFSSESDIWVSAGAIETGAAEITADGQVVRYGKNALIRYTLTLNGGSESAKLLREALKQQVRNGDIASIVLPVTATMINNGVKQVYIDGTLENSDLAFNYGNQKLSDQSWTFAFAKVVTTH